MKSLSPRARNVLVVGNHRVRITFTDGAVATVDLGPLLRGPVFESIVKVPGLFAQVRISETGGALEWPNSADLDPEVVYELAMKNPRGIRQPLGSPGSPTASR